MHRNLRRSCRQRPAPEFHNFRAGEGSCIAEAFPRPRQRSRPCLAARGALRADGFTPPTDTLSGTHLLLGLTTVPDRPLALMYDGASGKPAMCSLATELSASVELLGLNLSHCLQNASSLARLIAGLGCSWPRQTKRRPRSTEPLKLVTFHTWLQARKCSGASLRQGLQSPQQLSST